MNIMNIIKILVILFITNVNVIQTKNLNNEPFIPDPYDSYDSSTKSIKSSQNNEFIEPYDIIRNYRKLDDLRKNLIDHNLIEHMIKSGGIDMVIRFLKTFYPELMWNSVTQVIKNDFKTFYKIIRDPNGRRGLEYLRKRKIINNNFKSDDCDDDWEDKFTLITKPYRDKYSYKLNWANSWKDSDVW
jgi:hypothetical protein